jgi:hypothetical protein
LVSICPTTPRVDYGLLGTLQRTTWFVYFKDSTIEGGQLYLAGGVYFFVFTKPYTLNPRLFFYCNIQHSRIFELSSHNLLSLKQCIRLLPKSHISGLFGSRLTVLVF